jgi:hypothetical protein
MSGRAGFAVTGKGPAIEREFGDEDDDNNKSNNDRIGGGFVCCQRGAGG